MNPDAHDISDASPETGAGGAAVGAARPYGLWRLAYFLPAIVYMGIIFFLSSQPAPSVVHNIPVVFMMKVLHLVEYGVLAFLWTYGFSKGTAIRMREGYGLAVAITFAWGFSDEIHQAFVPSRTAAVADAVTDLVAAVLSVSAYAGLIRLKLFSFLRFRP